MSSHDLDKALAEYFGFKTFRPAQEEIVRHILNGGNALVIMPTGFGKSLCYQLPSVLLPGLTLVISPLIALAEDQVKKARSKGLKATFINSSLARTEREKRWRQVRDGEISLLYITPERLRLPEFAANVRSGQVRLLAIDEAHCISQWGQDFRPEYGRIGEARAILGDPPTLALTATATVAVQQEIRESLRLTDAPLWSEGFSRPEIHLGVTHVVGQDQKIQVFVMHRHQRPGPAILYFSLISSLEKFSRELRRLQIPHLTYHGQMGARERSQSQSEFMAGHGDLILATPAFGLGVDKADIRLLVHAEIPGSLEAYYQEAGRAGRDGRTAYAELLYDRDDVSIQMEFIRWANPEPEFVRAVCRELQSHLSEVRAQGADYLRARLHYHNKRDYRLETSLGWLERWGVIEWPHHDFSRLSVIGDLKGDWLNEDIHERRARVLNEKLLSLVRWCEATTCRRVLIHEYFGVSGEAACGFCDVCEGRL